MVLGKGLLFLQCYFILFIMNNTIRAYQYNAELAKMEIELERCVKKVEKEIIYPLMERLFEFDYTDSPPGK